MLRRQWKKVDFSYSEVCADTWGGHVEQMHMEAITFLLSSPTDCGSAGHDYNPELVEQKTLLLSLPSRLHVSLQQRCSKGRDAAAAGDPGEKRREVS